MDMEALREDDDGEGGAEPWRTSFNVPLGENESSNPPPPSPKDWGSITGREGDSDGFFFREKKGIRRATIF
jgi:hypothetical protein